ncbi:MAG: flagellar motor switch protein FliN [Lachnospiraceae bacterium]|jgi:flagellar motor switch protein FliN/FliY|nr:flagellar motor switch protein FliN [Lachnospiraceae bacterium]
MGAKGFNEMEIDAIGEIMNISLGASATAVSTLLGTKVDITTPVVRVQNREEFEFKKLEPAIGVEIAYVEGLEGKNVMIFRKEDVRIIVGTLMGEVPSDEAFEMDEIYISAICEIMNQMMGASATALSEFLGFTVNISTPKSFDVGEPEEFKDKYFPEEEGMVVVRFRLEIEEKLSSEFMNIMSTKLAKRLLTPFGLGGDLEKEEVQPVAEPEPQPASTGGGSMSQEEMDALMSSMSGGPAAEPAPQPTSTGGGSMSQEEMDALMSSMSGGPAAAEPQPASTGGGSMSQEEMDALMSSMSGGSAAEAAPQPAQAAPQPAMTMTPAAGMQPGAAMQQPYYPYPSAGMDPMMLQLMNQMQQTQLQMMEMMKGTKSAEPSKKESSIIRPLSSEQISDEAGEGMEEKANQEMLMKVPLEISVEIGRTKRLVRDILEFTQGTLVVLDKMAGEQVDLFVNGQCIARGDIVVVEDNFGIRITEIVTKELNPESL